jgi:hypothetical protein
VTICPFLLALFVLVAPPVHACAQVQVEVTAQSLVDDLTAKSAPGAAVTVLRENRFMALAAAGWAIAALLARK